ncbi:MAG TPA: 50S ribosomal protein L32 [Dehalococcoidia bacterium]|jgi:large subunit ribosomal protein L32|nr:50S ribosomal protein L32 [Dehalococcoidia bacterium]
MAPLPKKKTSTAKKKTRRHHIRLQLPGLVACPQCRSPKISHRACPTCGTYRGRDILAVGRERRPPSVPGA